MSLLQQSARSQLNGTFRATDVGREVTVFGWVQAYRNHGGVLFVDLRDRSGFVQLRCETDRPGVYATALTVRPEWVLAARGKLISRGSNQNLKIPTGEVEIEVHTLEVLSEAQTPPFEIKDGVNANEDLRLQYRYLDLRRPELNKNFVVRSQVTQLTRAYFTGELGFLELETPILTKSTPEGARDYLVPSRVHPGQFYALPQSPQQFKQLLMMAGMDRYMQICRCFRDEDLRADRQPEFTQLDLEISFVNREQLWAMLEGYVAHIWKQVLGVEVPLPLRRMSFQEAMDKYGCDKPDLRFGLPLSDLTATLRGRTEFRVFTAALESGGIIKALPLPDGAVFTRKDLDTTLPQEAAAHGAKGVAWARIGEDGSWSGPVAKALDDALKAELAAQWQVGPGALILFVADKPAVVNAALARLRLVAGERLGLIDKAQWAFLWVTDFPMFEYDEAEQRWVAMHHPFTSPRVDHMAQLQTDPGSVLAQAYDLVVNGIELGGGSIRIHQSDVQAQVFSLLGLSDEEIRHKFGFFVDALKYGTPPHGGIALGMDRMLMLLAGADSLRDVIAFPKTARATDLMSDAPCEVDTKQLRELSIAVAK
jgi:aspartyl-tRNA synthetase